MIKKIDLSAYNFLQVPTSFNMFNVQYYYSNNFTNRESSFPFDYKLNNDELPIHIQWSNVDTEFLSLYFYLTNENIPNHLKMYFLLIFDRYLALFYHILFNLPQKMTTIENGIVTTDENVIITNEEVINKIESISTSYRIGSGMNCGSPFELRQINKITAIFMKGRINNYEEMIIEIYKLLYSSIFDKEKIMIGITELINKYNEILADNESLFHHLVSFSIFKGEIEDYSTIVNKSFYFISFINFRF